MSSCRAGLAILVLLGGWSLPGGAMAEPPLDTPPPEQTVLSVYSVKIKPLLERYCYSCHGGGKSKGDLALDAYPDEAAIRKDGKTWETVLHHVRTGEMPPRNKPQPSLDERDLVASWIESEVFQFDCSHPDPGRVTIRRLNRVEYNNTIHDLVGVDFQPADDFPSDDVGYGFDNIGDVLSLPPILLEKYLTAAERILTFALNTNQPPNYPVHRFPADALESTAPGGPYGRGARLMSREGAVVTRFDFPSPGEYIVRVRAFGQQAGPEPPRMDLRLDDELHGVFDVVAVESSPSSYELHLFLPTGPKCISVAYLNNYVNAKDPDPNNRDRNLILEYLEVAGPVLPQELKLSETYQRLIVCAPAASDGKRACADRIIRRFATRAFRRPVSDEEVTGLLNLFAMADDDGVPFDQSVKVALEAVLISPHFLFRGELQPAPNDPRAVHPIDAFALASRLSYALWSSMPDDELFAQAARGTLRQNLDGEVSRMLRDPRADALVENFALQWLQVRNLQMVAPDAHEFPEFTEELRTAMHKETQLFCQAILHEDRSVLEFLDADYTFVNQRLAEHYRMTGIRGPDFRRVSLRGTQRGGVLTQASFLTITSNPTRTSPVKRGKWVLDNILGAPPPPPPPNVPELKAGTELSGSLRQRMEQHRENPLCASCHDRMDPIGFGFENFNAIGGWRQEDGPNPVDPAGQLSSGEVFQGPAQLRRILSTSKRDQFVRCLCQKMLTYALGRGLEVYDRCAVDQIMNRLKENDYRFSNLVQAIVTSAPFQLRRGEAEK